MVEATEETIGHNSLAVIIEMMGDEEIFRVGMIIVVVGEAAVGIMKDVRVRPSDQIIMMIVREMTDPAETIDPEMIDRDKIGHNHNQFLLSLYLVNKK